MRLYILGISSYRDDIDNIDIKNELKKRYKLETRRQNQFIHLGIYGAKKLKEEINISEYDELYITSGVGNIEVCQKATYAYNKNEFMTIYDFINMLGNTTSFYISKALNLKGKSIFQISDNFTFINSLVSIYASLYLSKKDAILGSIDLVSNPELIISKVLCVSENTELVSSVNYQKLSLRKENALGYIEFGINTYSLEEVKEIICTEKSKIVSSMMCENLEVIQDNKFFETMPSYYLNEAIRTKEDLIYIDYYENSYKTIKVINLL